MKKLEEKVDQLSGKKRFNPAEAFSHTRKENMPLSVISNGTYTYMSSMFFPGDTFFKLEIHKGLHDGRSRTDKRSKLLECNYLDLQQFWACERLELSESLTT